jgi:hypothetical protein
MNKKILSAFVLLGALSPAVSAMAMDKTAPVLLLAQPSALLPGRM